MALCHSPFLYHPSADNTLTKTSGVVCIGGELIKKYTGLRKMTD